MFISRTGVAVVAMAVLAALLVWTLQPDHAREAVEPRLPDAAPEPVAQSPVTQPPPAAPVTVDSAPDDVASLSLSNMAEAQLETARRDTVKFEGIWNADAAAPAGVQTEQAILAAMSSAVVAESRYQPVAYNANCRASMCRIETDFAAGGDGSDWATRLLLAMGSSNAFGSSAIVTQPGDNGGKHVVIYAFRPGYSPE